MVDLHEVGTEVFHAAPKAAEVVAELVWVSLASVVVHVVHRLHKGKPEKPQHKKPDIKHVTRLRVRRVVNEWARKKGVQG